MKLDSMTVHFTVHGLEDRGWNIRLNIAAWLIAIAQRIAQKTFTIDVVAD